MKIRAKGAPASPVRSLLKIIIVLLVIAGAAAGGAVLRLKQWAVESTSVAGEVVVDFKPGTTLSTLAQTLENGGIVTSSAMFQAYVRVSASYKRFQAGRYRFTGTQTPANVVDVMVRGETYNPIALQVTIPEGFTLKLITERLAANGAGPLVELNRMVRDRAFLQKLNVPSRNLEGYVFPATYSFRDQPTGAQALEHMVKTFWQNLPKDYEKRVNGLGLSLHEAVTFASLIEMETMLDDEKALISEVIWRRLKDKTPLGIDAALIYGIPDYAGDLKWAHLSDAKNPYNTRIHAGLPPTPIGSPGLRSLEAVLTPANFGYYYYVLMPGSTRHQFSRTLKEHNDNVKKLLKGTKRH